MKIGETKTNGYGCLSRSRGGFVAMVLPVAMICGIAHASGDPENIDDLGFNSVFDNNLFSSGFSLSTQAVPLLDSIIPVPCPPSLRRSQ